MSELETDLSQYPDVAEIIGVNEGDVRLSSVTEVLPTGAQGFWIPSGAFCEKMNWSETADPEQSALIVPPHEFMASLSQLAIYARGLGVLDKHLPVMTHSSAVYPGKIPRPVVAGERVDLMVRIQPTEDGSFAGSGMASVDDELIMSAELRGRLVRRSEFGKSIREAQQRLTE